MMVKCQGDLGDPFIKTVFTLNTCSNIVGSKVISFEKEADLLQVTL